MRRRECVGGEVGADEEARTVTISLPNQNKNVTLLKTTILSTCRLCPDNLMYTAQSIHSACTNRSGETSH